MGTDEGLSRRDLLKKVGLPGLCAHWSFEPKSDS